MTLSSEEDIKDLEHYKKNYKVRFDKEPVKDQRLKRNRVKCLSCGKIIESKYRHDFKTCACPQQTMGYGGLAYERYGG